MASIIWSGVVANSTLRVIDLGVGNAPRLVVESQQPADAMGTHGWSRFDPIPGVVFEGILLAAGVIT